MDATAVSTDQTKKPVQFERRAAWFSFATQSAVELSKECDWKYIPGVITENDERFFSLFEEYVTTEHAKHIILTVCIEFEEDLIEVLGRSPYFQARSSDYRCIHQS